jgi:acetate kinase
MDTTLVINPGSSSKKYALYQGGKEAFSALYEHTKDGIGRCVEVNATRTRCEDIAGSLYVDALNEMLSLAVQENVIATPEDVTRVGIRIVAPGTFFTTHRRIDDAYMVRLREAALYAPLHIPHQIDEIERIQRTLSHARLVGVSDSAFHATMPAYAHRYSIPREEAERIDLYRFGYHGLSVASVVRQVYAETGEIPERMVVCHIGSGDSVTAVRRGKSVDTTMGFAPTSGLVMGTRAGDVDVSALLYLLTRNDDSRTRVEDMMHTKSGLVGMTGSSDLRIVLDKRARGDKDAQTAVALYIGSIRKAIGAMTAVLGGVDTLVLTATAPERNPTVRALITEDFAYLGIHIDTAKNETLMGRPGVISTEASAVEVRVVHTQEIAEIAQVAKVF